MSRAARQTACHSVQEPVSDCLTADTVLSLVDMQSAIYSCHTKQLFLHCLRQTLGQSCAAAASIMQHHAALAPNYLCGFYCFTQIITHLISCTLFSRTVPSTQSLPYLPKLCGLPYSFAALCPYLQGGHAGRQLHCCGLPRPACARQKTPRPRGQGRIGAIDAAADSVGLVQYWPAPCRS
jgi:hypothetical protein